MSLAASVHRGSTTTELTAAKSRVLTAALDLFSKHGVGATSLGMIAAELGVTKAAVYHQFRTKHDIVLAVAENELAGLAEVIAAAEAEENPAKASDALLVGMIDRVIERGRRVSTMLSDPVIGHMFADYEPFLAVMERLSRVLHGRAPGPDEHKQTAILVAAISGALMHPFSADVDNATLRDELLRLASGYLQRDS